MPSPAVASAADAASFRGRTALVTGSSDGIGFQIARALAAAGARVLMPVRNRRKGECAMARILSDAPAARLELLDLDLARLDSVAGLASMLGLRGEPQAQALTDHRRLGNHRLAGEDDGKRQEQSVRAMVQFVSLVGRSVFGSQQSV